MKILSAAILIACVPLTTASAQLGQDASYFCIVEMAAGLAYDQRTKKWHGASLSSDQKVVLRLRLMETRKFNSEVLTYHNYYVKVTEAGSNHAWDCLKGFNSGVLEHHIQVFDSVGELTCSAGFYEYKFNLKRNRFLRAYLRGYVDEDDNYKSAPAIEGGTCTKID